MYNMPRYVFDYKKGYWVIDDKIHKVKMDNKTTYQKQKTIVSNKTSLSEV